MSDHHSKPPPFYSNLPPHLLENATPEAKWLMENISVLTQKTDYLVSEQTEQSIKLDELDNKLKFTNGKIGMAMKEIAEIQKFDETIDSISGDLQDIVSTKRLIGRMICSKWTWIIVGFFITGIAQVFTNPALREWLLKFL